VLRYTIKSLRAHLSRLLATALAVVVGIGFLAAGLMLTDAMESGLVGDLEQRYEGVDLAVVPSSPTSGEFDLGLRLQPSLLDAVRDIEGVAAAAGELVADVRVLDRDGDPTDLRSRGRAWIDDAELNPLSLVEGGPPRRDGEVVLDAGTAADAGVGVGDRVRLRTPVGAREAVVTGISKFGRRDASDPGGTVSFAEDAAREVLGGAEAGWSNVLVRVDGRVENVAAALRDELPGSVEVRTRDELVEDAADEAAAFIGFLRPALQGFAYLALFVASFVIFNTFSVVVTQRFRELALVRAIGGTPGQVRRSLLLEGLAIGFGASVVGIAAGALLALAIQAVLGWFDVSLPGGGVELSAWTVVLCLVVGTVVTVLSVLVPAFRAGRTKPVEAMRSSAVDTSGTSKVRAVLGATFLLASLLLLGLNQFVHSTWMLLAPGALLLFVGLVVGGPLLARLLAAVLRRPMSALGLTGALAARNAVRNPRRTATTANALVIGLFLVTLVTVAGEALKTALVSELNALSGSDYIVTTQTALADDLLERIDEVDGVEATAPVRSALTFDDGESPVTITTGDFEALERTTGLQLADGSLERVRDGDAVAVADLSGLLGEDSGGSMAINRVGDRIGLRDLEGEVRYLEVGATLDGELDSLLLGYLAGERTFVEVAGERPVNTVFVRVEPARADQVGVRLDRLLRDHTGVEVLAGNFIGQIVAQVFDFLIGAVNGLLGMSVVIALVGIVNTMTLSIFERRRELGMVRALGMTRQQVGRMILLEAFVIGLLGTLVGVAAGVLLGWVVVSSIDQTIELSLNWARVGLILLVGLAVGGLAAILPTRRATRLDMLDAMRSP